MLAENFQEIVLEDPLDLVTTLLEQIGVAGQAGITVEGLLGQMRDQTISNYLVMLLRLITSCEIRRRTDFFEPFILVRRARVVAADGDEFVRWMVTGHFFLVYFWYGRPLGGHQC